MRLIIIADDVPKPTKPTLELVIAYPPTNGDLMDEEPTTSNNLRNEETFGENSAYRSTNIVTTPTSKKKNKREIKSYTEILLEKQVYLFEEQLEYVKDIATSLKRKVEIEESRLNLEKEMFESEKNIVF